MPSPSHDPRAHRSPSAWARLTRSLSQPGPASHCGSPAAAGSHTGMALQGLCRGGGPGLGPGPGPAAPACQCRTQCHTVTVTVSESDGPATGCATVSCICLSATQAGSWLVPGSERWPSLPIRLSGNGHRDTVTPKASVAGRNLPETSSRLRAESALD